MQLRRRTDGKNKYADRDKDKGTKPEERVVPKHKAGDDVVTHDDLNEAIDTAISPLYTKVDDMTKAIVAFQESFKGSPKTEAQVKEMGEKHLIDVKEIQGSKKKAPIWTTENKIQEDFVLKGFDERMPRKEVQEKLKDVITSPTDSETLIEYQKLCDRIKLNCELLDKKPHQLEMYPEYEAFLEKTGIGKVLDLASAATDFIPEGWSMQTMSRYYQQLKVAATFGEPYPMNNGIVHYPIMGRPTARHSSRAASNRGTDTNEYRASDPDEGVVTFTARTLSVRVDLIDEYNEDSANVQKLLLDELIPDAMAEGVERTTINGDRQTNHQDNDIQSDTDNAIRVERAWDGLRRIALERAATYDVDEGTSGSGTFDFDDFAFTQQKGGKWNTEPQNGFFVISNAVYIRALTQTELKTKLNFEMPTNYNGQVTMINGRPVILSEFYPENLHVTGRNTSGGDNNLTGFTVYNADQFQYGDRRQEYVELYRDPLTGYTYVISTCRKDFQTMENRRTGYTPCASAISIDLTA